MHRALLSAGASPTARAASGACRRWQSSPSSSGGAAALNTQLSSALRGMQDDGTYKVERVISTPQETSISASGLDDVINFCANNYLGLSNHPDLVEAAKSTLDTHGFGLSSVRFICGTQDIHKELERRISRYHGMEDTILFPSCFDANAGLFEAILTAEDAVISDALNHASIIDGIRLCKAQRHRYEHLDMVSLESELVRAGENGARHKLIVTDGAFSMDGDIAPLDDIRALADKHGAMIFIDECHATGFMGPEGRGTDTHFGVEVDIINSTLGKALGGGTGGYTSGPQEIIDTLRQKARPYLFSNSLAPAMVGASIKVFDMLESGETDIVGQVKRNTHLFRDRMTEAGFEISGNRDHPIAPVMLGDAKLASQMADAMLKRGVFVIGFSYPVVPEGAARIRCQISAAHTDEQINKTVDAFIEVGKQFGAI
jgi:glycine C-acetyltransferase